MEQKDKTGRLVKYIKACVFWAVAFAACIVIEAPYSKTEAAEVVGAICNCFTVSGVVFAGIAGLSYVSYLGGYDGIGYAFSSFGLHNIFTTRQPRGYKNLYEYKQAKDSKGRRWLPHYLVVGGVSLGIGVILLIVYLLI